MRAATTWFFIASLALGCSSNNSPNTTTDCAPDGSCPTGYVCRTSDNTCQLQGVVDAAPPDMRPPDVRLPPDAMPGAAPDTTITSGPPALGNSSSVTFTFTANITPATFECSLDTAAFTACTSPDALTVADGAHTFHVRATANGQTDMTPASATFTVDTTPPDTTITSGPSGNVDNSEATFTFTATETGSTFQCQLDGQAFAPCVSGVNYTGLALGPHTFAVEATDPAGNVDPTPATQTWTVMQLTPNTTILTGPDAVSTVSTATFTFSSDQAGATFLCSLDADAFTPCASPLTLTGLAGGPHVLAVEATLNGAVDPTPATFSWTVDTTGPIAVITAGPTDGALVCTSVTFQYQTQPLVANATFECALVPGDLPANDSQYMPCPLTNQSYSGLTDTGTYTFSVRAIDSAGVHGAAAISTFSVDGKGPVIHITSPTGTTARAIAVDFTATDPLTTTYTCSVDGGMTISNCTTGQAFTGLTDGAHTVQVSGVDSCGNTGSASQSFTVQVSTTVNITSPADGSTTGPSNITGTYDPGMSDHVTCAVDNTAPTTPCPLTGAIALQPTNGLTVFTDGMHTFTVIGYDAAGHVIGMDTNTWTVDAAGPVLSPMVIGNPNASVAGFPAGAPVTCPKATITINCEDGSSDSTNDCPPDSSTCMVDGSQPDCSTGFIYLNDLGNGKHTVTASGEDPFGNASDTPGTEVFYTDATPPAVNFTVTTPSGYLCGPSGEIPWTTGAGEPKSSTFMCAIAGVGGDDSSGNCDGSATGGFVSGTGPSGALDEGPHTVTVFPRDACGNTPTVPPSEPIFVDIYAPAPSGAIVIEGAPGADSAVSCSNAITLDYAFTDVDPVVNVVPGSCTLTDRLGDITLISDDCTTTSATFTGIPQGKWTFSITVANACDFSTTRTFDLYVETGPPVIDASTIAPSGLECATPSGGTFTRDPGSSPASTTYDCVINSGATPTLPQPDCSGGTFALGALADGPHTAWVFGTNACNYTTPTPASSAFDLVTTAPVVAFERPPTAPSGALIGPTGNLEFEIASGDVDLPAPSCSLTTNNGQVDLSTCPPFASGAYGGSGYVVGPLADVTGDNPYSYDVSVTDRCTRTGTRLTVWSVDATAPMIAFTSPAAGAIAGSGATIAFTVTDIVAGHSPSSGVKSTTCTVDGVLTSCGAGSFTNSFTEAQHANPQVVSVTAIDNVGNSSTAMLDYYVDSTPPVVSNISCVTIPDAFAGEGGSGGCGDDCRALDPGNPKKAQRLAAHAGRAEKTGRTKRGLASSRPARPQPQLHGGEKGLVSAQEVQTIAACFPETLVTGSLECTFDVDDPSSSIPSRTDDTITCTCTFPGEVDASGNLLDTENDFDCSPTGQDGSGANLSGLADIYELSPGPHKLAVACTDSYGNTGTTTYSFTAQLGAGHAILIGHDYNYEPPEDDIPLEYLTSAAFLSIAGDGITNGIIYDRCPRYRGYPAGPTGQMQTNVETALTSGGCATHAGDFPNSVPGMTDGSATSLANALQGIDVLVIYDTKDLTGTMNTLGGVWASTLETFIAGGGTVITLSGLTGDIPSLNWQVMKPLLPGLAGVTGVVNGTGSTLQPYALHDGLNLDQWHGNTNEEQDELWSAPSGTTVYLDDTADSLVVGIDQWFAKLPHALPVIVHREYDCQYDFVVDTVNGNDSNSGTCLLPFKSMEPALAGGSGKSIRVNPGIYNDSVTRTVPYGDCVIGDIPNNGDGGSCEGGDEASEPPLPPICFEPVTELYGGGSITEGDVTETVNVLVNSEVEMDGLLFAATGPGVTGASGITNEDDLDTYDVYAQAVDDLYLGNDTFINSAIGVGLVGSSGVTVADSNFLDLDYALADEASTGVEANGDEFSGNFAGIIDFESAINIDDGYFTGNFAGIVMEEEGTGEVSNTVVDSNSCVGVYLTMDDTLPDLGGGGASSGGNTFQCNGYGDCEVDGTSDFGDISPSDINIVDESSVTLTAENNLWDDPPTGPNFLYTNGDCPAGADICEIFGSDAVTVDASGGSTNGNSCGAAVVTRGVQPTRPTRNRSTGSTGRNPFPVPPSMKLPLPAPRQ